MPLCSYLYYTDWIHHICSNRSQLQIKAGPILKQGEALKPINVGSRINAGYQLWARQFNEQLALQRGVASRPRGRSKCLHILATYKLLFQRF